MSARQYDLVVKNGTVVLPDGRIDHIDIAVADGKIAALLQKGSAADARASVDASKLIVMAGAIDAHVHLGHGKDITRPRVVSDAASETAAAASGGVTSFIAYLLGVEPYENGLFEDVKRVTEEGARVDFGYHFIISTEDQLAGVPNYASKFGVPSFKIFMNNRGGEGSRLGLPDIDDGFLYRLAEAAAKSGGMVCPHPENIEVSWVLRDREKMRDPQGTGGLAAWDRTRPAFVEADAVQRAATLCQHAGAPVYIVHTTSAAALNAGLAYRSAGGGIYIETCPHYLTHDVTWSGGDVGKINPPLRHAADRDALWAAVANGSVDTIASDHVHRDISSKAGGIWAASPGCPGLETLLPVMLSEGYHKRAIPLGRIADVVSHNPARIMGMSQKGAIAIGRDADFALIDLDATYRIARCDVKSDAGYSIYEDWPFKGQVVQTIVRGRTVYRDGELEPSAVGTGRYVSRSLSR
jgi:dihydropyrimidinase